jgi:PEGA domain
VIEQRGFIRVHAVPWANVSIDGKPLGSTPLAKPVEVASGTHIVRFTHDWYQPVEQTVQVPIAAADQATRVTVDFERDGKLLPGMQIPQQVTP